MKYALLALLVPLSGIAQTNTLETQEPVATEMVRPLPAYRPGFALMLSAGSTGIGGALGHSINRQVAVRVGANLFNYANTLKNVKTGDNIQIDFDYKASVKNANLMVDFYPAKRAGFRLTGGAFYNMNQIAFSGKSVKPVVINGTTFTADELGTFDGTVSFNKFAPYAGIGWGNPYTRHRLKVMLDVGFFYQQSPLINLNTSKLLDTSADPTTAIQNTLKPLTYYPVINLGLSYKF